MSITYKIVNKISAGILVERMQSYPRVLLAQINIQDESKGLFL